MKTCSRCARVRPVTDFHVKGRGYRRPECKDCFKSSRPRAGGSSAAGIASSDKSAYQRYYKYGITDAEFRRMQETQRGRCAICDSSDPGASAWQVDHDHETGRVRGLLCRPCNVAIGLMRDDVTRLARAIRYLDESGADVRV